MPKEFARQLLAYEAASGKRAGPKQSAAFGICEKLRVRLGSVMGVGGYSAAPQQLLERACFLSTSDVRTQ